TPSTSAWLGCGVSTLPTIAAIVPAGSPKTAASVPGSAHAPVSPSNIANAATPRPDNIPTIAPQALSRFHHTDRTRTGKAADALKLSDHRNRLSGSTGP